MTKANLKLKFPLQWEFEISNTWSFKYLQLKHAALSQLGLRGISFQNSTLEGALIQPEHTGLISSYYKALGHPKSNRLRPFWSQVTHFIAINFSLPNICSPKWCILAIFEDVELSSYQKQFLCFLLFYARKMVVLQWIYSTPISINI